MREARKPQPKRRPLSFVWLELTHRCNLCCRHCYSSSAPRDEADSMPTARWLSLLEEIADAGASRVQFTGGEPATHPHLFQLIAHARTLGLSVELFTNATLLDEDELDRIAALEVDVATSLHSHLPAVHEAITGVAGSHAATMRAITGLLARQVEIRVAAVLLSDNAGHGEEVAGLIRKLGVLAPLKTDHVRPTGRGAVANPSSSEPAYCGGATGGATSMLHTWEGTPPTCWDGKLVISPKGEVMPCIFARTLQVGSVKDAPLEAVLKGRELLELWGLTTDDVAECDGCDHKSTCIDCRALPLSVHHNLLAKSPRCGYLPRAKRLAAAKGEQFSLRPDIVTAALDDELLVLDPRAARLHRLNSAASMILGALDNGSTRQAIKQDLVLGFDIPPKAADRDVDALIEELASAELIEPGAPRSNRIISTQLPTRAEVSAKDSAAHGAQADFPPTENLRTTHIDCGGVTVSLHASEELTRRLADFFSSVVVEPPPARIGPLPLDQRITIVTRRPGPKASPLHHVFRGDRRVRTQGDADGVLGAVEILLCTIAAESDPGTGPESSLRLHAAALAGPMGAVLLPAAHGAGKSTFAAWAHAAGMTYLGDEVARVRSDHQRGHLVTAFPKPIKLKPEGLSLVPEALAPMLYRGSDGQGWLAVQGDRREYPLAAIVVLRREGGSPILRPLDRGDTVEALMSQTFNLRSLGPKTALDEVCALALEAPSFLLDVTDLPAAAEVLAAWSAKSR